MQVFNTRYILKIRWIPLVFRHFSLSETLDRRLHNAPERPGCGCNYTRRKGTVFFLRGGGERAPPARVYYTPGHFAC
jgi:hypothetical protein